VYFLISQADESAALVAGMTADLAIANSIIEDFRDVTLDVLDAVTTIEHIAVEVRKTSTTYSCIVRLKLCR
jgi:hypothetical protein